LRVLYCNSFEVGHSKEAFCLVFKFQSPEGNTVDTVYVTIGPSGTKTLIQLLQAEMEAYQKEYGLVEPWKAVKNPDSNSQSENTNKFRV